MIVAKMTASRLVSEQNEVSRTTAKKVEAQRMANIHDPWDIHQLAELLSPQVLLQIKGGIL